MKHSIHDVVYSPDPSSPPAEVAEVILLDLGRVRSFLIIRTGNVSLERRNPSNNLDNGSKHFPSTCDEHSGLIISLANFTGGLSYLWMDRSLDQSGVLKKMTHSS